VVIFVSGKKSSNGTFLYDVCKGINEKTYFISGNQKLKEAGFVGVNNVGVCGATSTPMWLMEDIAEVIRRI